MTILFDSRSMLGPKLKGILAARVERVEQVELADQEVAEVQAEAPVEDRAPPHKPQPQPSPPLLKPKRQQIQPTLSRIPMP